MIKPQSQCSGEAYFFTMPLIHFNEEFIMDDEMAAVNDIDIKFIV